MSGMDCVCHELVVALSDGHQGRKSELKTRYRFNKSFTTKSLKKKKFNLEIFLRHLFFFFFLIHDFQTNVN